MPLARFGCVRKNDAMPMRRPLTTLALLAATLRHRFSSMETTAREWVGRVTPCAPPAAAQLPNDAYGGTRPTLWRSLLVAVLVAADVSPLQLSAKTGEDATPQDSGVESLSRFTSAATSSGVAADVNSLHLQASAAEDATPQESSLSRLTSAATGVEAAAVVAPPTNAYPLHIVVLQEDEDLDGFLAEHGLTATLKYRSINGFAALLPAAALKGLQRNPRVQWVETDGPATLAEQTLGNGSTSMGVDQFPGALFTLLPPAASQVHQAAEEIPKVS